MDYYVEFKKLCIENHLKLEETSREIGYSSWYMRKKLRYSDEQTAMSFFDKVKNFFENKIAKSQTE